MGYQRPTTPFLDYLAKESFVVPNAVVGGVPTYYSLPSLLASRSPLSVGRDFIGLAPGETSLPVQLKEAGYASAAFIAANPYVSRQFGYEQAFDTFRDFLDHNVSLANFAGAKDSNSTRSRLNRTLRRLTHHLGPAGTLYDELYFRYCQRTAPSAPTLDALRPYPAADTIVHDACNWLSSVSGVPFFLWVHFMDAHAPYYPPPEALRALNVTVRTPAQARYLNSFWNRSDLEPERLGAQRDAVMELYDAGICWIDAQVASLVERLKELHAWDRCALVLTADHGEEFLEHGGRFHQPGTMKEELIHVPLLMRIPGVVGGRVSRQPFSHLDLAPTVMDALGLLIPVEFQGTSRWHEWCNGDESERTIVIESAECANPNRPELRLAPRVLCVRDERYKLIMRFSSGREELFDLQQDPAEEKPLPDEVEKRTRRRLLEHARKHVQHVSTHHQSEFALHARLREVRRRLPEPIYSLSGN
jgi:arylsulfatase A-like enzyme